MLTHERLSELLVYDPESGVFTWLQSKGTRVAGKPAGYICLDKGMYVTIDKKGYRAHRLAWFYMTGVWPTDQVGHIDRNPNNNVWANLREATASQNSHNTKRAHTNTSGVKGVVWIPSLGKWRAQVKLEGVSHYAGDFDHLEPAAIAVRALRERLHGEFTCHG
ncbi:HNH endonuclease signature motif containing protein [Pseudomonas rubra]|uniref:HNH endonuclease n=1 Tax=Pseudomonas rubra TaxID=2942627 RepID=A0ABT5PEX8_9PSED|nr:HNH endonuclease signature motif containing protein [Pseudomonas rubra]MDD1016872.1 HNH endonuclease [Pseudomonas rubra]MDD1039382.1 HNH endonuclease [Pseudomonas rubra]MDD1157836.1 HNH endonuclease [Pseudomonas rubra]